MVPAAVRAQNISTVAGGGPPATVTTLLKTGASVGAPAAVRQDSLGNTYILDNDFSRVYKVGYDRPPDCFSQETAPWVSAVRAVWPPTLPCFEPSGMCIDASNNVYVADSDNAIIREIVVTASAGKTVGNIYTVAGVQTQQDFTYGGDGGLATAANLHFPMAAPSIATENMVYRRPRQQRHPAWSPPVPHLRPE